MMTDSMTPYSGNPDMESIYSMILHDQAAVGRARIVLQSAKSVVTAQAVKSNG